MIPDRGYDEDWLITALKKQGVKPCMPPRKTRKKRGRYSKTLYRQRHTIESTFGRITMRYNRCAHTLFSAIWPGVTVILYLKE